MAQLFLDDLVQSMADAAKEAGGRQWEALRRRAMPEFTNLAETAMEVERRKVDGDSSEEQSATLMRMHMRRARHIITAIEGVPSRTLEGVVESVNDVLRRAVVGATGWKGF